MAVVWTLMGLFFLGVAIWEDMNRNMPKQERIFRICGNSKGLVCPFKTILCQEGHCHQCQIYLDWQRKNSGGGTAQ